MSYELITPEQCKIIATTAPIFLFVLVEQRRHFLEPGGRNRLLDVVAAAVVLFLGYSTIVCCIGVDEGIKGGTAPRVVWTAWQTGVLVPTAFWASRILREAKDRRDELTPPTNPKGKRGHKPGWY